MTTTARMMLMTRVMSDRKLILELSWPEARVQMIKITKTFVQLKWKKPRRLKCQIQIGVSVDESNYDGDTIQNFYPDSPCKIILTNS